MLIHTLHTDGCGILPKATRTKATRTKTRAIIEEPAPKKVDIFNKLAEEELLDPE